MRLFHEPEEERLCGLVSADVAPAVDVGCTRSTVIVLSRPITHIEPRNPAMTFTLCYTASTAQRSIVRRSDNDHQSRVGTLVKFNRKCAHQESESLDHPTDHRALTLAKAYALHDVPAEGVAMIR